MMRGLVKNLHWKAFSLALAFTLWVTIVAQPELGRSVSVPIEYQNMPEGLEMSSNTPEEVRLEVRGSAARLSASEFEGSTVVLNLGDIREPGERTFTFSQQNVRLPWGVRVMRAVPAQIRLGFENRQSRPVPVRAHFINIPRDYRVQSQQIDPPELRVTGPESRVKGIDYAETDPIDVSKTVSEAEFRVHVFLRDPQVRFASPPTVRVKVVLSKT